MKDQEEQYSHLKEEWSQRVLSFVQVHYEYYSSHQYYQKSIVKENDLNASTNPVFPQGLLTTNLGVPILVTCVNTHVMVQAFLNLYHSHNQGNLVMKNWILYKSS